MAEITGKTGTSRVVDLGGNEDNMYTPQYAVYDSESGSLQLKKVILFNYMTDPNGASNLGVTIKLTDGTTIPGQVAVKYVVLHVSFGLKLTELFSQALLFCLSVQQG